MRTILALLAVLLFAYPAMAERQIVMPAASFTRPNDTTAYSIGDLIANSITAANVTPMTFAVPGGVGQTGYLRWAMLRKSSTGVTSPSFRLHIFTAAPTVANGDNGALSMTGSTTYVCTIDVSVFTTDPFSDGNASFGVPIAGSECPFISSGSLFGLLEARAAYAPGAQEIFTLTLGIFVP